MARLSSVAVMAIVLARAALVAVVPGAITVSGFEGGSLGSSGATTMQLSVQSPHDTAPVLPQNIAPILVEGACAERTQDMIPMTTNQEERLLAAIGMEYDFALGLLTKEAGCPGPAGDARATYASRVSTAATAFCNSNCDTADIMRFTSELAWARAMYLDAAFRTAAGGELASMSEDQSVAMWSDAAEDIAQLVEQASWLRRSIQTTVVEPEPPIPEAVRKASAPGPGRAITKRG